jgi:hypothetical protein
MEGARSELAAIERALENLFEQPLALPVEARQPGTRPLVRAIGRRGARRLVRTFLSLPEQERIRIADEMGLLRDGDDRSADFKLYETLFSRAREAGLLDEMTEQVEAAKTRS